MSVLLGQRPSLYSLGQRCSTVVRAFHWYYAAVRFREVHPGLLAYGLLSPACGLVTGGLSGFPVLVREVPSRAGVRLRKVDDAFAFTTTSVLPSAIGPRRHPDTDDVRVVCYSVPVPLLHRRLHADLSRRTPNLRLGHISISKEQRKP